MGLNSSKLRFVSTVRQREKEVSLRMKQFDSNKTTKPGYGLSVREKRQLRAQETRYEKSDCSKVDLVGVSNRLSPLF